MIKIAAGTLIRLVQENGNLIELEAQNMVMTTSRKVGGSALPFMGSRRVGFDLNVNSAMINISGIISDDSVGTTASKAAATVNFGQRAGWQGATAWTESNNMNYFLMGGNSKMQLRNTAGTLKEVTFTSVTARADGGSTSDTTQYDANAGGGNTPTVLVNKANVTPVQMASAVTTYINTHLSADFTAAVVAGNSVGASSTGGDTQQNCVVSITQTATGTGANDTEITFDGVSGRFIEPTTTAFNGGTVATRKSAGDKVMDLYGVLNNSTTQAGRLAASAILGAGAALAIVGTGGAAALPLAAAGAGTGVIGLALTGRQAAENNDYICAIQIPYNSTIKAESGELYTARNFFMPTGRYRGKSKTSEGNDHPASVEFDHGDEKSGIQGSVQKMDITYDAGETVYNFNMIFAPIDNLL